MGVREIRSSQFREEPAPPTIFSKEPALLGVGQGEGVRSLDAKRMGMVGRGEELGREGSAGKVGA